MENDNKEKPVIGFTGDVARFAVVVEGRLMFWLYYPEVHHNTNIPLMQTAVMRSNPKIVEVPNDSPATIGWVYDDVNFHQPSPEMMAEFMEYIV